MTAPSLQDALIGLADHGVADAAPPDPDAAWARGRRHHRRRVAVHVLAATAVLLATGSVALTGILERPDLRPAGDTGSLGLPHRFYDATPWLGGTDGDPVGPLVAVQGGLRNHPFGDATMELVGISATGEYRFLDLPDRLGGGDDVIALSADGRWLGYWAEGPTEQEPNTFSGAPAGALVLHDTVTGTSRTAEISSPHGVMLEEIGFAGDSLVAPIWEWDDAGDSGSGHLEQTLVWSVDEPAPRSADWPSTPDLFEAIPGSESLVSTRGRRLLTITDDRAVVGPRLIGERAPGVTVSPDGSWVAAVAQQVRGEVVVDDGSPQPLLVGSLDDQSGTDRVQMTETGAEVWRVVGWRDDQHVVAEVPLGRRGAAFAAIDVTTGESELLVRGAPTPYAPRVVVAADAWAGETYDAAPPPDRMDPRWRYGVPGVVVLVAVGALVVWRRRARA